MNPAELALYPNRVAITGTRDPGPKLVAALEEAIALLKGRAEPTILVTGGCVGIDAFAAMSAHKKGIHVHTIIPANTKLVHGDWRKYCVSFRLMDAGTTYRERDQAMVDVATQLFVFPRHPENHPMSRRSGTWLTCRLARKAEVPYRVFECWG